MKFLFLWLSLFVVGCVLNFIVVVGIVPWITWQFPTDLHIDWLATRLWVFITLVIAVFVWVMDP